MKSIKGFMIFLALFFLVIGGWLCTADGDYERTIAGEGETATVYSEYVVNYPTKEEYVVGGSLIGVALLILVPMFIADYRGYRKPIKGGTGERSDYSVGKDGEISLSN